MTNDLTPEAEVVRICRDLIQIDSSNYGDGSGPGERACAEYVMGELTDVGLDPLYVESAPRRAEEKHRLCTALDRAGVDMIELGHPGAAPDIDAIELIAAARLRAELVVHCRTHPADIERAAGLPVGRLALFLGTSPSHLEGKLRISRGEALRRVGETVAAAVASGKRVRFSAEDAFRTDPGYLTAMAPVVVALRLLDGVHTVDPAALVGLSSMVEQMS
jgi:isopropylmalate/homocitrate/citramalate synthase